MSDLLCPECGEKIYSSDDICMNCGSNIKGKRKTNKKETTPSNEIGSEILADLGLGGGISEEDVRPAHFKKKNKKKLGCLPIILFILIVILICSL
jgi:uncharacterized membrane protein YvbJ